MRDPASMTPSGLARVLTFQRTLYYSKPFRSSAFSQLARRLSPDVRCRVFQPYLEQPVGLVGLRPTARPSHRSYASGRLVEVARCAGTGGGDPAYNPSGKAGWPPKKQTAIRLLVGLFAKPVNARIWPHLRDFFPSHPLRFSSAPRSRLAEWCKSRQW
jgi:hypothetical protein